MPSVDRVLSRLFTDNFCSSKVTHSKLGKFFLNLMPNKVKVTNFQNYHQESHELTIFGQCWC